jgi:hypothetical protein
MMAFLQNYRKDCNDDAEQRLDKGPMKHQVHPIASTQECVEGKSKQNVSPLRSQRPNTSEVQNKMIFMGHQILSCHVPVVRSFFILWKMLLSS